MVWRTLQNVMLWLQSVVTVGVVLLLENRKALKGYFPMYLPCILLNILCDGTN